MLIFFPFFCKCYLGVVAHIETPRCVQMFCLPNLFIICRLFEILDLNLTVTKNCLWIDSSTETKKITTFQCYKCLLLFFLHCAFYTIDLTLWHLLYSIKWKWNDYLSASVVIFTLESVKVTHLASQSVWLTVEGRHKTRCINVRCR